MGTRNRFLVPWRPSDELRETIWRFCRSWWDGIGLDIVEGSSPPGPFNRAAALNDAAAGDWDVGVILDADVICEHRQVLEAVELAERTGRIVFAFERYVALNPWMSRRVLAGYRGEWAKGAWLKKSRHESSVVVVPRSAWDAVGGFDERFVGWGQEDVAFVQATRVLVGEPQRVPGTIWHIYHGRAPEKNRLHPLWKPNQELGRRYRDTTDPEAMLALLGER